MKPKSELDLKLDDFLDGFLSCEYVNEKENGIWKVYYDNGQLEKEGNVIDGKEDGTWKYFYKTSELQSEGNYNNGKRNGVWFGFHENGTKRRKSYFNMGEVKEETCWDKEGNEIKCEEK